MKERIIHICLLSGIFLVYYLSGMKYEYLIFTTLAIIGMKNKSIKKVMRITFLIYFICLIGQVLLLLTGVIEDEILIKVSSGERITTHTFGFVHGNTAFTILFTLICSYVYSEFNKIKIWHLVIIEIIAIILYFLFYARTGLAIITLFLIGTATYKFTKTKKNFVLKVIRKLQVAVVPIMFIGTYILSTFLFDTQIARTINRLVSDRLRISNTYFSFIPPGAFPQNFEFIDNLAFDNMYSFIILSFGFIFTTIVILAFVYLYIKLLKKKRYFEMYIITLFALYSYAERMYINSFKNPSILFLAVLIYKDFKMFDCEEKK
ncbi:MAG: hypothetical protein HFJ54_03460 [Clostridia bacterium]|nr:hypothetical protein [Clostridia bacterium]